MKVTDATAILGPVLPATWPHLSDDARADAWAKLGQLSRAALQTLFADRPELLPELPAPLHTEAAVAANTTGVVDGAVGASWGAVNLEPAPVASAAAVTADGADEPGWGAVDLEPVAAVAPAAPQLHPDYAKVIGRQYRPRFDIWAVLPPGCAAWFGLLAVPLTWLLLIWLYQFTLD